METSRPNAIIRYEEVSGDGDNIFTVTALGSEAGQITLTGTVTPTTYTLVIRVSVEAMKVTCVSVRL